MNIRLGKIKCCLNLSAALLIGAAFLTFPSIKVHAKEVRVTPSNISDAIKNINNGDTVTISSGRYYQPIDLNGKNDIKIKGEYPNSEMDGGYSVDSAIHINNSTNINIHDLTMKYYKGAGVYLIKDVSGVTMKNLTMHDFAPMDNVDLRSGTEGILAETNISNCTVENCTIYNMGYYNGTVVPRRQQLQLDHGIYLGHNVTNWTINANRLYSNVGAGIQLYTSPAPSTSYSKITNNIIYKNGKWGLVVWGGSTNNKVYNNTFYGNGEYDISVNESSSNNIFRNNIMPKSYEVRDGAYNTFDHNCTTDPQFVSYNPQVPSDFRVKGISPTTGMGIDDANTPLYDFAGTLREKPYQEIGAYDYNYSYDNFEGLSSNQNKYTTIGGNFTISYDSSAGSNVYQQSTYSNQTMKSIIGDSSWSNYTVESKVKMLDNSQGSDVGVIARASQDGSIYYVARMQTSGIILYKVINGNWTSLGYYTGSYSKGTWYNLSLTCMGSTISVGLNGNTIINATDSSISSGKAGMYTSYYASWDNFKVYPRQ